MKLFQMMLLCLKKALRSKQISKNNLYSYILDPFLTALTFCLMNSQQDMKFVLAGVSIIVFWSINIFECSYLVIDEKAFGTLGNILVSPFRTQSILFSEELCSMLLNIPTILVVFLAGYCIAPYKISVSEIGFLFLGYTLSILSIATIGLLIAILLLFTRSARGIMNIIGYPFYILSGVLIPVEQLPGAFKTIAMFLPTTHAFKILQISCTQNSNDVSGDIILCILEILILHVIISRIIRATEKKVIIEGTLDIF